MERRKQYIDSPCIKQLISKGRIPMLFIGSGISKRYLVDYPSWDELIQSVAKDVGVSNGQLIAMRQEITDSFPSESKGKINAELGSKLTKIFRDKVINGELKLENIFTTEEISKIEKGNITFAKMLISKKLSKYEITAKNRFQSEITEFRKLQNTIGAVVTTNYDRFLEVDIFNNFDVFVEQSQYYMTESVGIGEIYKIHGSIEAPNSLVFSTEDYQNFNDNLRVIAAKLLNLALEYPIIFMGYSLEDDNVISILNTLVSALNKNQLEALSENLIYVEWKPNEKHLKESKRTITRDGKSLEFTCISTDNYFVLYKHLLKFTPAERPTKVRKYKKMIQKLIIDNNSGTRTIIGNSKFDELKDSGNLVVAFGKIDEFAHMGIVGLKGDDIVKWVMEQKKDISKEFAESIFKDFYLKSNIPAGNYIPMFYIEKFTLSHKNDEKIKTLKSNLTQWVDKLNKDNKITLYTGYNSLKDNPDNLAEYKYISCIVKSYSNNYISYDECLELLKDIYSDVSFKISSDFRKAVSYLDMKA